MDLQIIKLSPDCKDMACFEQINNEAFPSYERISMEDMFGLTSYTDTDVLGIYDGNVPVGFTLIVKNEACGYVYFLAIDRRFRSHGYGSAAIKKLLNMYSDLQLVLDFEEIDESSENNEQRIRRKAFYLRNGFYETGRYTMIYQDRFEVVSSCIPLRAEALTELIHLLHTHNPKFADTLI